MSSKEKIESYILQMEMPYEELDDGLWIMYEADVHSAEKLVISCTDSIVHFRLKVMEIPESKERHCELFKKLLELNAVSLSHGAFAIEKNAIVLIDSLQLENLDYNEFQASVEAIFFGIIDTYDELSVFLDKEKVC